MLIDEESARESAVTLLTVLESPAIDSAAIESKPVRMDPFEWEEERR
jgi:hypothetical protein